MMSSLVKAVMAIAIFAAVFVGILYLIYFIRLSSI